jgi:hypothetical protein
VRLDHISKAASKKSVEIQSRSFIERSHPGLGLRIAGPSSPRRSLAATHRTLSNPKVSGGDIDEATPDPIPNSEVKLVGADGTAREAVWESRTLPGFIYAGVKTGPSSEPRFTSKRGFGSLWASQRSCAGDRASDVAIGAAAPPR